MARNAVVTGPYVSALPLVTSDTVPLVKTAEGLLITTAGNVKFIDESGNTNTITGAAAGAIYPIRVSLVFATLTTATVSALNY